MSSQRTFVVGDLHLTRDSSPELARDVARLLERHAGERMVIAGDFFDLVTDAPDAERAAAIAAVLAAHPNVRAAIGRFLDDGGQLAFTGGNHDADVGRDDLRPALLSAVQPSNAGAARLSTSPWFLRDGDVHIEHGHFYDPDNAPAHPLVIGAPSLGIHFSSEFISRTQAHRYLQANDATPLKLFLSAWTWYGQRAPYVIYRYFHAAFTALAQAGPFYAAHGEKNVGQEREASFAEQAGVPAPMVDAIMAIGARSTLESWSATFARLYLDRVAATVALGVGVGAFVSGHRTLGTASALLGGMLMATSWINGHNRYRGTVVENLSRAAERIATDTHARLVVFGHTHREALEDRYANTGSFAFPRQAPGRPYLELVRDAGGPRAVRHYL